MTWRVAQSLEVVLAEVNELAPSRSKVSDGSIGDAAHASRESDHNPWVIDSEGIGVVRARDFTHDPLGGFDCNKFAAKVADLLGAHPALGDGAYVIWNRRIMSTARVGEGWRTYSGTNAHDKHCHVSVGLKGYDATLPWLAAAANKPEDEVTPEDREAIAELTAEKVRKTLLFGMDDAPDGRYLGSTLSNIHDMLRKLLAEKG